MAVSGRGRVGRCAVDQALPARSLELLIWTARLAARWSPLVVFEIVPMCEDRAWGDPSEIVWRHLGPVSNGGGGAGAATGRRPRRDPGEILNTRTGCDSEEDRL